MIFGLLRKINTAQPVRQGGLWDVYISIGIPHHKTHSGSAIRPVLTCFEDSYYSGSVIYCIASPTGSPTDHIDTNLKNIGWNDKISAIGWQLVVDFSVFNGENPQIPAHPGC